MGGREGGARGSESPRVLQGGTARGALAERSRLWPLCARAAGWVARALNTWFWENTLFWFTLDSSLIHLEELKPTETSFKLKAEKKDLDCPVLKFL